jgi:hypothetical protein
MGVAIECLMKLLCLSTGIWLQARLHPINRPTSELVATGRTRGRDERAFRAESEYDSRKNSLNNCS